MARNRLRELGCSWSLVGDECMRLCQQSLPRFGTLPKSVRFLALERTGRVSAMGRLCQAFEYFDCPVGPVLGRDLLCQVYGVPAIGFRFHEVSDPLGQSVRCDIRTGQ